MALIPETKVNSLITFQTPVTIESYLEEWKERQNVLKEIKENYQASKLQVSHANGVFNELKQLRDAGKLTAIAVRDYAKSKGATEFFVHNMQADQSDGFKLKYVKAVVGGKPVFTDSKDEAMKVDGVFIFDNRVVIRLFTGYVQSAKTTRTQVTVELLNTTFADNPMNQNWVDNYMKGLSAYAFKVNGIEVCPAGMWAQYGVDPANKEQLVAIMDSCHLMVSE